MNGTLVASLPTRSTQRPYSEQQLCESLQRLSNGHSSQIQGHHARAARLIARLDDGRLVQIITTDGGMHAFSIDPIELAKLYAAPVSSIPGTDVSPNTAATSAIRRAALDVADPVGDSRRGQREDGHNVEFPLSPVAQGVLGQGLATMLSGGTFNNAFGNAINPVGLGMAALGQVLSQAMNQLMSGWSLDDDSSTGEYVAHEVVQKLIEQVQKQAMTAVSNAILKAPDGPGGLKQLHDFFGPPESSAKYEAACFGTPDDQGNFVTATHVNNVLVQGCTAAAALSTDILLPASKPISDGSTTVRLGGETLLFARETSVTAVPSVLQKTGVTVLVGGDSPRPAATKKAQQVFDQTKDAAKATKASDDVTAAADHAKNRALANGSSEAEAEAKANVAAEQAANRKPVDPRVAALLNEAGYRDGKPGLREPPGRESLSDNDVVYIDPATGRHYTERELADMEVLGADPYTGMCNDAVRDEVKSIRSRSETWSVLKVYDADKDSSLSSGYRMVVFKRYPDGQMMLDYAGTNFTSLADWQNNIAQGFGLNALSPQYAQAVKDANQYLDQDAGLIITGHSLGGGLATYAGAMTGTPVISYNPAGLGSTSMSIVQNAGEPLRPGQFTTYVVDGEILTGVSTALVQQPGYFGQVSVIEKPEWAGGIGEWFTNILDAHQIQTIIHQLTLGNVQYFGYVKPHIPPTALL